MRSYQLKSCWPIRRCQLNTVSTRRVKRKLGQILLTTFRWIPQCLWIRRSACSNYVLSLFYILLQKTDHAMLCYAVFVIIIIIITIEYRSNFTLCLQCRNVEITDAGERHIYAICYLWWLILDVCIHNILTYYLSWVWCPVWLDFVFMITSIILHLNVCTKNYWNRSTFDWVILKTKRWQFFFETQCRWWWWWWWCLL